MSLDEDLKHPGFVSDLVIPLNCRELYLCSPANRNDVFRRAGIDYAGLSNLVDGYRSRRLRCWHHIALFTLEGQGVLLCDGRRQSLDVGTVCVLPAGLSHEFFPDGAWTVLWLHVVPGPLWMDMGACAHVHQSLNGAFLRSVAERLWTEMESRGSESAEAVRLLSETLLHFTRQDLGKGRDDVQRMWRSRLDSAWARVAADPGDWNVTRLCHSIGTSRTTLVRICGRLYGFSPSERIQELRMSRARDYLLNTNWTLQNIAAKLGYSDEFSFSKAFSRQTGESPSSFRRNRNSNEL